MGHIGIYTNCIGSFIYDEFLSKFSYFKDWKYTYIQNYFVIRENYPLDPDAIGDFHIFIYNPIDIKHGIYSTFHENGILSKLKPSCIRISFPSVHTEIWPIYETRGLYYGGEYIVNLMDTYTLEEILEMHAENKLFFNLQERFRDSIRHMQIREKSCTIQSISGFIQENIKTARLFYTMNHPTEDFVAFIADEICKCLEESLGPIVEPIEYSDSFMRPYGMFEDSVYMQKELGLEYIHYDKGNCDMGEQLAEYIKEVYKNPTQIRVRSKLLEE